MKDSPPGGTGDTGAAKAVALAQSQVGLTDSTKADGKDPADAGGRMFRKSRDIVMQYFHEAFGGDDQTKNGYQPDVVNHITPGPNGKDTLPSWCGIFPVWALRKAGFSVGPWITGKSIMKIAGVAPLKPGEEPRPGDVGAIQHNDHQYMVVSVHSDGNGLDTIEGNTDSALGTQGGQVAQHNTRTIKTTDYGFIRATGTVPAVQRSANVPAPVAPVSPKTIWDVLRAPAAPLDEGTRAEMESSFGHDLSQVRVHSDAAAAQSTRSLNAAAYTVGSHIVVGERFELRSDAGRRLLAHELTHVLQQLAGPVSGNVVDRGLAVSDPSDPFEREAEQTADSVMAGRSIALAAPEGAALRRPVVQRAPNIAGCETVTPEAVTADVARTWATGGLPVITRTKEQSIVVNNAGKTAPTVTKPLADFKVDPSQCARVLGILDYLQKQRDGFAVRLSDANLKKDTRSGKYGYMASEKDKGLPAGVPSNDPGKEADPRGHLAWVLWREVGSEGSAASINTYDTQLLTFGKGFGAKGQLPEVMKSLLARPAIANAFLDAGFYWNGTWLAVDLSSGGVETGDNALKLVIADTKVLSFLMDFGENLFPQESMDAQWAALLGHAGKVPAAAQAWDDRAIAIVAHICHGTGADWNSYTDTGGDLRKVLAKFFARLAGKPEPSGARISHALVNQPDIITSMKAFGAKFGGSLWTELEPLPVQKLPRDISTNSDHAPYIYVVKAVTPAGKEGWILTEAGQSITEVERVTIVGDPKAPDTAVEP